MGRWPRPGRSPPRGRRRCGRPGSASGGHTPRRAGAGGGAEGGGAGAGCLRASSRGAGQAQPPSPPRRAVTVHGGAGSAEPGAGGSPRRPAEPGGRPPSSAAARPVPARPGRPAPCPSGAEPLAARTWPPRQRAPASPTSTSSTRSSASTEPAPRPAARPGTRRRCREPCAGAPALPGAGGGLVAARCNPARQHPPHPHPPPSALAASPLKGKVFLRSWVISAAGWGVSAACLGLHPPVAPRDFFSSPLPSSGPGCRLLLPAPFPCCTLPFPSSVSAPGHGAVTATWRCLSRRFLVPVKGPGAAAPRFSLPLSALASALADLLLHPRTGFCREAR